MAYTFPKLNVPRDQFGFQIESESTTPDHIKETYILSALFITIKNGKTISLGNSFNRLEVYEDIFSPSITGKISVYDYVGGIEKFMFTGGETITLRVTKPGGSNETLISRDDLIVYEIGKIQYDNENAMTYELSFTSKSAIASQKKRLYKSFGTDKGLRSVFSKIYSDVNAVSNINVNTIDPDIKMQNPFVCPGYTPLEALSQLARRSCALGDYFVFYEKLNGRNSSDFKHVFISLGSLKEFWNNADKLQKLVYQPSQDYINRETNAFIQIKSFLIENNFQHLERMQTGFYNSNIRQIDPYSRKYTDSKISYKDMALDTDFYTNRILENNNEFLKYDDTYPEFPGERLIVKPKNDIVLDKANWIKYDTYGGLLNSGLRVLADIPGADNRISVGYAVELALPSKVAKAQNLEQSFVAEDEFYSGKYLVTAVRHIFTKDTYIKKIELSRGSLKINLDRRIEQTS
jgi:hypothetical protein